MTKSTTVAALALTLAACAGGSSETVFDNGDRLVIVEDEPGPTAETGELVTFHVTVANGDTTLESSREAFPEGQKVLIPPPDTTAGGFVTLLESFRRLSVGDSAVIYTKLDSNERLPPWVDVPAGITYGVRVLRVLDTADTRAFQDSLQAATLAAQAAYSSRLPAVQDSVAALLEEYSRAGPDAAGYTTTESGLRYKILEAGTGTQATPGSPVLVSYYGALTADGSSFDNSFKRGQSFGFPLGAGRVIPGWDEGIALLREGARAMLIIPSDIGYGERGSPPNIPPGAELAFYVQLDEVR